MGLPMPKGYTMRDVYADNARTSEAARRDREFDRKAEAHFRNTHKGLRNGRNFLWDVMRHRDSSLGGAENFEERYNNTFMGCPGSPEWYAGGFCPVCDKRRSMCECQK